MCHGSHFDNFDIPAFLLLFKNTNGFRFGRFPLDFLASVGNKHSAIEVISFNMQSRKAAENQQNYQVKMAHN